jgi:hypothetical protein
MRRDVQYEQQKSTASFAVSARDDMDMVVGE